MSVVIDSNAPYFTEFPMNSAGDAVYMTADDPVLGSVFAIVYRAHPGLPKLSVILVGAHGVSGYVDMTLDRASRFFGACRGLASTHFNSPVRRALAIAVLRTYATVDKPLRQRLRGICDESSAGSLGSRFRLVYGKYPGAIGARLIEAGLISPKKIESSIVDIIYEDNDLTIDQNNELVYLLGEQLEQLFDPLSEYSPEPTEKLYSAPIAQGGESLDNETKDVQDLCEELYLMQAHARGDILDLLQTTLIPLRIEVLRKNFPGVTIARLNTVFPPTIDELFRVNNIFYEALRSALPFGAFEVIKACGTTIPYFFRACMRHEAATQKFSQLFAELLDDAPDVLQFLRTDRAKLENVIRNPLYLRNVKKVLDRLVAAKNGASLEEQRQIDEFYAVASSTFNAFGEKNSNDDYRNHTTNAPSQGSSFAEQKKIPSAGRMLGELAQDWPVELEYGWLDRRVVSIFDAVDTLEPSDSIRQLHVVFIVFTDSLVVCRPSEPIPATSLSGLHVPSVGDMLMHAMLNEAPIDSNLPPLKVISWAPIMDVHFASYERQYLYVFSPGIVGSYRLLQPDSNSSKLVSLLSKAKITTKTQPFHLFKLEGPETVMFSTVQEIQGYTEELNRTKIAIFLSKDISEKTLRQFNLCGAVSVKVLPDKKIQLTIISRMRYNASFIATKSELRQLVINEIAYLMTLSLSSQNQEILDIIITSNKIASSRLIKWASESKNNKQLGHKTKTTGDSLTHGQAYTIVSRDPSIPSVRSNASLMPVNRILRRIPGEIPEGTRDINSPLTEQNVNELDRTPSVDNEDDTTPSVTSSRLYARHNKEGSELSSEEAEQRDVDNWYHQLNHSRNDNESLSSGLSDTDIPYMRSQRQITDSHSIQIGGILDRSTSNLYNKSAGEAFPRIETPESTDSKFHQRQETETSFASLQNSYYTSEESFASGSTSFSNNINQLGENEDFSYLASLVDDSSIGSRMNDLEKGEVYPDLRETSLVRLGSYIMSNDQSYRSLNGKPGNSQSTASRLLTSKSLSTIPSTNDAGEETPTLQNNGFSATVESPEQIDWVSYDRQNNEGFPKLLEKRELDKSKVSSKSAKTEDTAQTTPVPFTPYADLESAEWHPQPVRSGTNRTLGGRVYFPRLEDINDNSFEGEDGNELAQDWLRWTKNGRPLSMISCNAAMLAESTRKIKHSTADSSAAQRSSISNSKSQHSFRRMIMSSSLHTLQLASFTVQIDQKQISCSMPLWQDLENLKIHVTSIYRSHHNVSLESEKQIRTCLVAYYQLLLKQECEQLAAGLLEIEWVRRTRIVESRAGKVSEFWKHDT